MQKKWLLFLLLGANLFMIGCKSEDALEPKMKNNSIISIDLFNSVDFVQRNSVDEGEVTIVGTSNKFFQSAKIKFKNALAGKETDWQSLTVDPVKKEFKGKFNLKAGGYYPQIQLYNDNKIETDTLVKWNVGVGEIFAIIGHSIAEGQQPYIIENFDGTWCKIVNWKIEGANNNFWGRLAEKLKVKLNMPVKIFNTGLGGSNSEQWAKSAYGYEFPKILYDWKKRQPYIFFEERIQNDFVKSGLRSVLIIHGENDTALSENEIVESTKSYIQKTRDLLKAPQLTFSMAKSNSGSGLPVNLRVQSAQKRILLEIKNVIVGADLETLSGPQFRWDGVHFNSYGLEVAANRWNEALPLSYFSQTTPVLPVK